MPGRTVQRNSGAALGKGWVLVDGRLLKVQSFFAKLT